MTTTKRRLLDAAAVTLRQTGATGLTLDAVARQAGISKGGLLHHFPTKDALIETLLVELMSGFDERVRRHAEAEPSRPGGLLRAYVRASFESEPMSPDLSAVLLGAIIGNAALLALVRQDGARWRERLLADGVPRARALLVQSAADAAWTQRLLEPGDDPDRDAVQRELLRLTSEPTW